MKGSERRLSTGDEYLCAGNYELEQQNYRAAIKYYSKSLELENKCGEAYLGRALAYKNARVWKHAIADISRAADLMETTVLPDRAEIEAGAGHYDDAIRDLQTCLVAVPKQAKDIHPALNWWTGRLYPRAYDPATIWQRIATFYFAKANWSESVNAAERAIEHSAVNPDAYFIKAKAEAKQGRLEQAASDARTAAEQYFTLAQIVKRDDVNVWLRVLTLANKTSEAIDYLTQTGLR